jgi:hypothetical protein
LGCPSFSFILNSHTNTPPVPLTGFQAMFQQGTRKTRHSALGSTISVHASKMTLWIRNELRSLKKLVSFSIPTTRRTRKIGIRSSRNSMTIMKNMVTVSCCRLSTVLPSSKNTCTNTLLVALPNLQAVCQSSTRENRNWADGSTISVHASKMAIWIRNELKSLKKLVSI